MIKILIVEDEKAISNLINVNLTAHGYRCFCAYDGKEAADLLEENTYDLVLLDIMLPEIDGYELLEYVKYQGTPVIFVTAKGTLEDKIKGLRMGADDYLVKPFQIGELIARVEAVLRRAGKAETEITLFGVTVNTDSRTVKKDGELIDLTVKEFDLLVELIRNKNVALYRDRLGRDYLGVGKYTESVLPDLGVRFIAINDGVDSEDGENELAPFKNIMNEMYARDISRKVRSAHRIRGNAGEPLGPPPYGYIKDPANPKRWIVEPEAAAVVREIFKMSLEGKGSETIARILQERKVLNCTYYWKARGDNRNGRKWQENPYYWKPCTVASILNRVEYCGDLVNFKTYSKSFKNKQRYMNPDEKRVVFRDAHEPIIDRETFELVQKKRGKTKRRAPKKENGEKSIFADLLTCADCGHKLWFHVNTVNKAIRFFACSNYVKDYRGTCPTRHYIREDALYEVVRLELRRLSAFLQEDEAAFAELLSKKTGEEAKAERMTLEEELRKARQRKELVANLYEKLYEDNALGKVTDEWYSHMSLKYEVERVELKAKIAELEGKLKGFQAAAKNNEYFIRAVRRFMDMDTLTAPLLKELIDRIEVSEVQGKGKNRTQRIVIHYRFARYLDLEENYLERNIVQDTRQGVAVEYVPHAAGE